MNKMHNFQRISGVLTAIKIISNAAHIKIGELHAQHATQKETYTGKQESQNAKRNTPTIRLLKKRITKYISHTRLWEH